MKNDIKGEIIISMLNMLGLGVNSYSPNGNLSVINTLKKLLPNMNVSFKDETTISINDLIYVKYTIINSRVTNIELIEC